ncbi:MAG: DUF3370 family protein, partial [Cyanobacteria bacterium P01_H01_bin.153]
PESQQDVVVELIYPPDATPPQVLTITTLGTASARNAVPDTADVPPAPEAAREADQPAGTALEIQTVPEAELLDAMPTVDDREALIEETATEGNSTSMEQFGVD